MYQAWPKGLQLVEKDVPRIADDTDVQLKVIAGGICGTDVGIYQSKDSLKNSMSGLTTPDVTIGHEFCGRIVDAGPKARLHLATQVIAKAKEYKELRTFVKGRTAAAIAKDKAFIPISPSISYPRQKCTSPAEPVHSANSASIMSARTPLSGDFTATGRLPNTLCSPPQTS